MYTLKNYQLLYVVKSTDHIEIQTRYTVIHNTSMPYNNMLYVPVHQNHHQAPLLQKLKKHKYIYLRHANSSLVASD